MTESKKVIRSVSVSPLAAELIDTVVDLPADQQRELLAELNSQTGLARRKFTRHPHRQSVQFAAGGKLFSGSFKDISEDGAFVETLKSDLRRLAPGEEITIAFEHPGGGKSRYVKRSAEIARTSQEGIGVRFYNRL